LLGEQDAARTLSKLHPRFIGTVIGRRYPGLHEYLPVALGLRGRSMRFSTVAAAVCLSLWTATGGIAAAPLAPHAEPLVTGAPAGAKSTPAPSAAQPSADAAAKHAKRTACLKDAKAKKLVGAEKASFLKTCLAAP
jgi:hypothetical protein